MGDHHGDTLVVHGDALAVRGGGEGRRLVQVRHQVDALLGVDVRQAGERVGREQGELLAGRWRRHWVVERERRIAFVLGADRSALDCAHQTQISSATNSRQGNFHPISPLDSARLHPCLCETFSQRSDKIQTFPTSKSYGT